MIYKTAVSLRWAQNLYTDLVLRSCFQVKTGNLTELEIATVVNYYLLPLVQEVEEVETVSKGAAKAAGGAKGKKGKK